MRARPAVFALFAVAASPALAQQSPAGTEAFKSVLGKWEISNADRDRVCVITFRSDGAGTLFRLDLDKGCPAQMPELKDVVAWTIGGLDIVRLVDPKGKAVMEFTEVESGIFEGVRQNEGVYILQNLAAARSLAKSMDQMIGDWAMVRGNGQAICGLTLTNTDAGQDNFQVFLKPKCDAAITAFAPTKWRLEHGQMLLMSDKGETWQFEADDNAQWRLVPDSANPLIMLRQ